MANCVMTEIKLPNDISVDEHAFFCTCSECQKIICASAKRDENGKLIMVSYSSKVCPNCGAEIIKFVACEERK